MEEGDEIVYHHCIHTTTYFHPYKAIVIGVNHYFLLLYTTIPNIKMLKNAMNYTK